MKAKDLSDKTLKEFVDAVIDWHQTGTLKSDEFRREAENTYKDAVDAFSIYEGDVLFEASRRYSKTVGQVKKPSPWDKE